MFGYVRPSEARLSEADKERFAAAYCGLCRTLGERYGLASRFILNYDFAFLAILLWEGAAPPALSSGLNSPGDQIFLDHQRHLKGDSIVKLPQV